MNAEIVVLLTVALVIALYGAYKYWKSDDTDFKVYSTQINELSGEVEKLNKKRVEDQIVLNTFRELSEINSRRLDEQAKKIEELTKLCDDNKKRSFILNNKLLKTPMPVKVINESVPVSIVEERPKNVAKQTPLIKALKKSVNELSK